MKHLTPLTHTLFKALWLGAALNASLSLVAAESPTKTEPKPAKGVKNKPKSPVTKVMMTNCDNLKDFNAKQKEVLKAAYQFGSKENLGYEMAGIAWKESCAGVYKINFSDPSAGVYHSYIPSVLKSYGHNDSPFLRNVMGELLIKDDAFASEVALKELLYWKTRYHDNLKDMIKSYNKGSRWEKNEKSNADAEKYYEEIQDRIRRLKESKIFDSQSSNDQELQKSANSNLDLDPIGNAMPQTLAAQKSQIEKSQIEETQAEKPQEMKEATSEQIASKPEKEKDKPMYFAQINSADFTPAKKSSQKPAKASPKRSSKNNISVKNNTKTASKNSKNKEVCKNCSPGQRNAILANHITLMQEL
ncbi:type VII secretion EssA family protein [Helicobacter pylori]|nr:type VII secretion EssA family protein [Helicobacter pylori]